MRVELNIQLDSPERSRSDSGVPGAPKNFHSLAGDETSELDGESDCETAVLTMAEAFLSIVANGDDGDDRDGVGGAGNPCARAP